VVLEVDLRPFESADLLRASRPIARKRPRQSVLGLELVEQAGEFAGSRDAVAFLRVVRRQVDRRGRVACRFFPAQRPAIKRADGVDDRTDPGARQSFSAEIVNRGLKLAGEKVVKVFASQTIGESPQGGVKVGDRFVV
jgi:hypothetical protein